MIDGNHTQSARDGIYILALNCSLGLDAIAQNGEEVVVEQRHRGAIGDTVLLLEHPPVFTAGKRTDPHERPADPGGAAVIDVDRGGKITFHGPGQLVGYPIVRLPDHVKVVDYVRRVEEALEGAGVMPAELIETNSSLTAIATTSTARTAP